MPFQFTLPKLSPTMEEGVIAKWHKKEGEFVEAGELLLEITTDKATVEHNALDEGWLRKILIPEGGVAKVNQPIAIFSEDKNESIDAFLEKMKTPAKEKAPKEKISAEPKEEFIEKEERKVAFREPVFAPERPLEKYEFPLACAGDEEAFATPLARKLAKDKGLDISSVKGSGPGGRVTSEDLEKAAPQGFVTFSKKECPTIAPGSYEEMSLTPMRKTIGRRLQESKTFIPHYYVKQVVDAKPLVDLRAELQNLEIKVTFNDLIIRATALALKKHPEINSGFNTVNQTIVRFKTIDISVAVVIPDGLITPIIRHADYKNVGQISAEMKSLTERARSGKLKEEEYKGGSFCVSNLGMFGITEFSAVINPPQAAILAVGGIEDRPVVKNGHVIAGKTLALVLSADHRVIDGALASHFLKTLQLLVENPASLIL